MTLIEVLSTRLLADAALAAVVEGKIYPSKAPQETAAPFVVFFIVSAVPEGTYTTKTGDDPSTHRLQVDCYGEDALQAAQLAQLVGTALGDQAVAHLPEDPERGLQVGKTLERVSWDDVSELDRVLLEFSVFW